MNYMQDWNSIIEYIENITYDILDVIRHSKDEDSSEREIHYILAIYSLMLLRNFSCKS